MTVTVDVGGRRHEVTSGRGGYVDSVLAADLPGGWAEATVSAAGTAPATARIRVVDEQATTVAVISDVDDTVLVTALPRPLLAAWNTFVRHETTRRPVRGMATLYREIERRHPETPFVYLSTGAWNVAPVLEQFLKRHAYPPGPLLMTDWGPTQDSWFRSGREHKRRLNGAGCETVGVSVTRTVRLPCVTATVEICTSRPMTTVPVRSSMTTRAGESGSTISSLDLGDEARRADVVAASSG